MSNTPAAFCCCGVSPLAGSEGLRCHDYLKHFHGFGRFGQCRQAWLKASAVQRPFAIKLTRRRLFGRTADVSARWFELFTADVRDDWGNALKTEYFFREAREAKIAAGDYRRVPDNELFFDCIDHGFRFTVDMWKGESAGHVAFRHWWAQWSERCERCSRGIASFGACSYEESKSDSAERPSPSRCATGSPTLGGMPGRHSIGK